MRRTIRPGRYAWVLLLAAACVESDIERYGSGWSLGIKPRAEQSARAIERSASLVESLRAEGYRVMSEGTGRSTGPGFAWESHSWVLEGEHPDIGPIRITIDATTDTAAERQLQLGVRFSTFEKAAAARAAFEDRFLALARAP